jgi:hypothetical protein
MPAKKGKTSVRQASSRMAAAKVPSSRMPLMSFNQSQPTEDTAPQQGTVANLPPTASLNPQAGQSL